MHMANRIIEWGAVGGSPSITLTPSRCIPLECCLLIFPRPCFVVPCSCNTSAQRFEKMVGMAAMLEVKKFTPFAFRRVRSTVRVLLLLLCSVSTE